jgi:hypothetical protein
MVVDYDIAYRVAHAVGDAGESGQRPVGGPAGREQSDRARPLGRRFLRRRAGPPHFSRQ